MSTTAGRLFTGLTRAAFSRVIFIHDATTTARLSSVRSLALSSQSLARSTEDNKDEPIKFSTSKASHRTWKVDRSMENQFQQPWQNVLGICLVVTGFLLWCVLRQETDIDGKLHTQLQEHFPDLLSDEEEEQAETKSR